MTQARRGAYLDGALQRLLVHPLVLSLDGAQVHLAAAHDDPDERLVVRAPARDGLVQPLREVGGGVDDAVHCEADRAEQGQYSARQRLSMIAECK